MKKYKTEEEGHYMNVVVMQPEVVNVSSENVASDGVLCRSDNRERYRDCDDYNTAFCRTECEFGLKEKSTSDGLDSDK